MSSVALLAVSASQVVGRLETIFHVREGLEGIQEASDALGRVVAGLAFEHSDLRRAVELLGNVITQGMRRLALVIPYHGTDRGGERWRCRN